MRTLLRIASLACAIGCFPPAATADPLSLQERIDRAAPGDHIQVPPGTYRGDLIIRTRVHVTGVGRPLLLGSGNDSVVQIRADGVVFEGFEIDGKGGGDLGRDASGIHVWAPNVTVRDCFIHDTLFGIYLREANGAVVERNRIRGIPGKQPGEKGSGIHVWNTDGFRLIANDLSLVRDGMYVQSSPHGFISGNRASDLRYGLHYMFSDDNRFEDNVFERGDAGAALMYSRRITFARNRFLHNRGFASVGLLFKEVDDVIAEDNLIGDNARGLVVDTSYRNRFVRNIVAGSDVAVVLYDSCAGNVFEENSFVANLSPLSLVGRHTDTIFRRNYWSDNSEPDFDGDGVSDRPYPLTDVFDHFRGNVLAADLYAQTAAAAALALAERAFPVLPAATVHDTAPLVRVPHDGARGDGPRTHVNLSGLILAAVALAAGAVSERRAARIGS